ncbi:hypothetical protein [Luteimicrobium sp. DT211]|uniref:hypothetical protein n=1 Tax=Luteimicrobium sp. DT211 TaxID=3393412 RepID=UPI003CF503F5
MTDPRPDPVRLSLDLAPPAYRQLRANCDELAVILGRTRVTQAEVLRVLVTLLNEDAGVREAVTTALQAEH